jgi:hypothetical protein
MAVIFFPFSTGIAEMLAGQLWLGRVVKVTGTPGPLLGTAFKTALTHLNLLFLGWALFFIASIECQRASCSWDGL